MWLPETDCKKKRLLGLSIVFQGCNRLRRNPPVEIGIVRHIKQAAVSSLCQVGRHRSFNLWFITAVGRIVILCWHTPGVGVTFNLLPPVVKNLADIAGEPACLLELLRQRHDIRVCHPEMCGQVPDLQPVKAASRQQRCPRRVADRLLTISRIKGHTAVSQPINIRCLRKRMSVAAEVTTKVIGGDEQDVGSGCQPTTGGH